jgi:hypothetical protein
MTLSPSDKKTFIETDLYHELRCLLGATTLWRTLKKNEAGFDVIVAMDSAFVHSRCLFNFFTQAKSGSDISITEFGPADAYASAIYQIWYEPLNRHVLHISKGRMNPANVYGNEHLNEQVEGFAGEILSLWRRFESDPAATDYAAALTSGRERAIRDATNDAAGRIPALFGR